MKPELDHVFICCACGAPEAEALLGRGFPEGSPNTHPGQGTANRRFFFADIYLELLWVANPIEARNERTQPTRLWERSQSRSACPFGLVYRSGGANISPPFETWPYRPVYLPPDVAIEFAIGTPLEEPELLFLPFVRRSGSPESEPISRRFPASTFRGVTVGRPSPLALSASAQQAQAAGMLSYRQTAEYLLELDFASPQETTFDLRPTLPLVIRGSTDRLK